MDLDLIRRHIRDRAYMSGIARDAARIKATQEIFTPTSIVQDILARLDQNFFSYPDQTFLDPSCGDGQFLGEVLIRKVENGIDFEQALQTIYGVDIMQDNVDLCRERLLCGREDLRHIVEQNIYQADALKFNYKFLPMSDTRRKKEDKNRLQNEKARQQRLRIEKERKIKELMLQQDKKFFGQAIRV